MKRLAILLLFAASVGGQGGRDGAKGVLFVALDASVESDAIHRAAWRALEPHNVERRRMATFAGDEKKARAYLRQQKDAKVVVAYDPRIAALAAREISGAAVLKVYEEDGAHVHAVADRKRFYAAIEILLGTRYGDPDRGKERGGKNVEGFGNLAGVSVEWIREGAKPRAGDKPVVSTSAHVPEGRALLTMRPDPRSLGLLLAVQILRHLRTGKPFARVTVKRMRLTVDLGAAKRAGIVVPLRLLARADVVRRP